MNAVLNFCIVNSSKNNLFFALLYLFVILLHSSVCHGYLALKELGRNITDENTKMYDGSWTEWSKEDALPKILPKKE